MKSQFNARYVRMYGTCDDNGAYLNNLVTAAYSVGLGIHATIWFGFDGDDSWMGKRDQLVNVIRTNPLAKYVIRTVDVGSEPLYDWVSRDCHILRCLTIFRSSLLKSWPTRFSEPHFL